jgi:hypothetical protein
MTLERRRQKIKSILLYKILNDYTVPHLKESLIKRVSMQVNYNLRNSNTDIALPKPRRKTLEQLSRDAKEAQSIYSFKMNI